jgi:hypothetical protein
MCGKNITDTRKQSPTNIILLKISEINAQLLDPSAQQFGIVQL